MSMFTRCAHCESTFRVTLAQLQASGGQVRCGVCLEVFDAFLTLTARDPRVPAVEEPAVEAVPVDPALVLEPPRSDPPDTDAGDALLADVTIDPDVASPEAATTTTPDSAASEAVADGLPETASASPTTSAIVPEVEADAATATEASDGAGLAQDDPPGFPVADGQDPDDASDRCLDGDAPPPADSSPPHGMPIPAPMLAHDDVPEFVDQVAEPGIAPGSVQMPEDPEPPDPEGGQPRRLVSDAAGTEASDPIAARVAPPAFVAPRPSRPSVAQLSGVTVLALLLVAQVVYLLRAVIADAAPNTRPALEAACAWIRCSVALPRLTDRLTIETSDLQALDPLHPNRVTLTATIRNRARVEQAFPMLELTLTDAREEVAARKVFGPTEYLAAATADAGIAANAEVGVRLRLDTADLVATGYRLYLFHP